MERIITILYLFSGTFQLIVFVYFYIDYIIFRPNILGNVWSVDSLIDMPDIHNDVLIKISEQLGRRKKIIFHISEGNAQILEQKSNTIPQKG